MRILLVDDEAIQRKALRVELSKINHEGTVLSFREAANGRECLDIIPEFSPHIIFLDLRMPVMGGLEVAQVVAGEHPGVKVVILTAFDDFKYAQEAVKAGAIEYLLKPASRADLCRVMDKVKLQLASEESARREKDYVLAQLEKVKPYIEMEYISDIINGTPMTIDVHQQKSELLNIRAPLQLCLLLELDESPASSSNEPERQALKQRVNELLREEIGFVTFLSARVGGDRILALLSVPQGALTARDQGRTWVSGLAEKIRNRVNSECGLQISIGISRYSSSAEGLHKAYQESKQALGYKFMLGPNQIVHIDDVDLRDKDGQPYSLDLEKQLAEAVRLGNVDKVPAALKSLLDKCFLGGRLEANRARTRAAELIAVVTRAAAEGGAPQADLGEHSYECLQKALAAHTMQELTEVLSTGIAGMTALITGLRNVRNQRLVSRAIEYINSHYQDQVTLEDLARQVYLSPFYFSHIFKEEIGQTFIEYLTQVRIEEAKKRLRDSMVAVSIIAEQVGYNDVNYFSRVFKKVVGLTPTQYREKLFTK